MKQFACLSSHNERQIHPSWVFHKPQAVGLCNLTLDFHDGVGFALLATITVTVCSGGGKCPASTYLSWLVTAPASAHSPTKLMHEIASIRIISY